MMHLPELFGAIAILLIVFVLVKQQESVRRERDRSMAQHVREQYTEGGQR